MAGSVECIVTAIVPGDSGASRRVGPVRFARGEDDITIGRGLTAAVRLDQPWISTAHVLVRCVGPVWHVENGSWQSMRVRTASPTGKELVTADVAPGGHLFLGEGRHQATWPKLRAGLVVDFRIASDLTTSDRQLPYRQDRKLPRPPVYTRSTAVPLLRRPGLLPDRERRHRLAVVYAHLLDVDIPKPKNVYAAAEARFKDAGEDLSADTLKKFVKDSWEALEIELPQTFRVHEFGDLLVELAQITPEDLHSRRPAPPRGRSRPR
jgi:hypothetical protein